VALFNARLTAAAIFVEGEAAATDAILTFAKVARYVLKITPRDGNKFNVIVALTTCRSSSAWAYERQTA
jgi:hypothetical protein